MSLLKYSNLQSLPSLYHHFNPIRQFSSSCPTHGAPMTRLKLSKVKDKMPTTRHPQIPLEQDETYEPWMLNIKNAEAFGKDLRDQKDVKVDVIDLLQINPRRDYKNVVLLTHFVSDMGYILPRKETGLRIPNQIRIAKAIRRARSIGLLPAHHKMTFYGDKKQ